MREDIEIVPQHGVTHHAPDEFRIQAALDGLDDLRPGRPLAPAEMIVSVAAASHDVGRDIARAQNGCREAPALAFHPQRLADPHDRVLRRHVRAEIRIRLHTRRGGRVHDVLLTWLRLHARKKGLQPVDDAVEIDAEHPLPIRVGAPLERLERGDPGVVAEHMRGPEALVDILGERFDGAAVDHVRRDRQRLAADCKQLGADLLGRVLVDVRDRDPHTRVREGQRHPAPNAAATARDDGDLPVQILQLDLARVGSCNSYRASPDDSCQSASA